jgi:hypothetical protein
MAAKECFVPLVDRSTWREHCLKSKETRTPLSCPMLLDALSKRPTAQRTSEK